MEIAGIARAYEAEAPFFRHAKVSDDSNTDYEFVLHALNWLHDNAGMQPEYLVLLRPSTPSRNVAHIDAAIERILKDDRATALRSMHEIPEPAHKTYEVEEGYLWCICAQSFGIKAANQPRQKYSKNISSEWVC